MTDQQERAGRAGTRIMTWVRTTERTLDDFGRPAWLVAMVLGFVLFWPIGLIVLGYMLWSGRMGCWGRHRAGRNRRWRREGSTGNRAFDAYREETLERLEEERQAFSDFLDRLRMAKDKAEFDQFLDERRGRGQSEPSASGPDFQPAG